MIPRMPRSTRKPFESVLTYFQIADLAEAQVILHQVKGIVSARAQPPVTTPTTTTGMKHMAKAKAGHPDALDSLIAKQRKKPGPKPRTEAAARSAMPVVPYTPPDEHNEVGLRHVPDPSLRPFS